ncbi:hypothetical protein AOZ06_16320 [Kibdelosporangium phytohabitans]|uniref:Uncharacterized protein n=1 Tax=Kibdelosporangium phytohabitans TaxID=860235 RepID=A0A0N9I1G6_9PSEU|nr:hypothetical protein AOZ06_16320 [Kibdelosporangium phytohabitans]
MRRADRAATVAGMVIVSGTITTVLPTESAESKPETPGTCGSTPRRRTAAQEVRPILAEGR